MNQSSLSEIILDQTKRTLWEVRNVIDCVPDECWNKTYCEMPLFRHIYHMLHSLDLWFVNPRDKSFQEPSIHEENLNNLDIAADRRISRTEIMDYFKVTEQKIENYVHTLRDNQLLEFPAGCEYTKFTLILAQYRHLHTHLGMIMGFIIDDTGSWPRVVGLEGTIPQGDYDKYF